jgi:hypothetical protein
VSVIPEKYVAQRTLLMPPTIAVDSVMTMGEGEKCESLTIGHLEK